MTKSLRVVICPWILDQVQQIVWLYIRRDCILLGRSVKFCLLFLSSYFLHHFVTLKQDNLVIWSEKWLNSVSQVTSEN